MTTVITVGGTSITMEMTTSSKPARQKPRPLTQWFTDGAQSPRATRAHCDQRRPVTVYLAYARCMPDFVRSTSSKTAIPATMAATNPMAFG